MHVTWCACWIQCAQSWHLRWPLQSEPEFLCQLFFISFFSVWCFVFVSFHLVLPVDTNTQFHNRGQFHLNFLHVRSSGWQQIFSTVQNPLQQLPPEVKVGCFNCFPAVKTDGHSAYSTLHYFAPELQPRHYHFVSNKDNFGIINVLKGLREVAITLRSGLTWWPKMSFSDRYRPTVSGVILMLNRSGVLSCEDHCRRWSKYGGPVALKHSKEINPIFPAFGNSEGKRNNHPYDKRFVMHRLKVQLSWNNRISSDSRHHMLWKSIIACPRQNSPSLAQIVGKNNFNKPYHLL